MDSKLILKSPMNIYCKQNNIDTYILDRYIPTPFSPPYTLPFLCLK